MRKTVVIAPTAGSDTAAPPLRRPARRRHGGGLR